MMDAIDLAAMPQRDDNSSDELTAASIKAASDYTSTALDEPVRLRLGKQGLAACAPQTIPQFFRAACRQYAGLPALVYESQPASGDWTTLTFAEYERQVQQAALHLIALGLEPHATVGLWFITNSPAWYYAELGALRAGGVVAGIYPSSSAEAVHHVLHTSAASVCVVENADQMLKVRAMRSRLPHLRAVVQVSSPFDDFVGREEGYHRWADLMGREFDAAAVAELEQRERNIGANECAMLIYTSGTVGLPKAVMLSHDGVVYDTRALCCSLADMQPGAERIVTYLPLNHIAAQVFDVFMTLLNGVCVYFADRNALKGTLTNTLAKARPTRMFGVPRIFEKIQEKLVLAESKSSLLTRYILQKSRAALQCYHLDIIKGKSPSSLKYWWALKVTQQIKLKLGLDQCKSLIVGGAPISDELKLFFLGLDMPLSEVYGMSEGSGAITMNAPLRDLLSVGRAFEGIELKINNPDQQGHGEICIRGRPICMGYLNDVAKTQETLKDDGWLHSGDVGYMDGQSQLVITGRIKELIITAGGENIPPVHIEEYVKRELPCLSNALLVGDRRKYLTMLLTLKTEADPNTGLPRDQLRPETIAWLQSLHLPFRLLSEVLNISPDFKDINADAEVKPHPDVLRAIEAALKRANVNAISNAQRVQKFALLPYDFSLPTGELGPTLKIRRNIVLDKYAAVIERLYK